MIENELGVSVSLDGVWAFQLADHAPCQMPVPSAWEAHMEDRLTDGPVRYRREFELAALTPVVMLCCDAIAFAATIWINGHRVGEHTGMWSGFHFEVTPYVRLGVNEIQIEVWKPGAKFPLRETLAGFLPDVANTFGGIWQHLELRLLSGPVFQSVCLVAQAEHFAICGWVSGMGQHDEGELRVKLAIYDDSGQTITVADGEVIGGDFDIAVDVKDAIAWTSRLPMLYTCVCQSDSIGWTTPAYSWGFELGVGRANMLPHPIC